MSTPELSAERKQLLLSAIAKVAPRPELIETDKDASTFDGESATLSISVLSGGITNELFRVKNKKTGYSVVVRVYGKETDRLISRDAEQFFQSKFLRTFGRYENVLIYEFLDGLRALEPDELPVYADAIANALAEFHVRSSRYALQTLPYATQELHCINVTTSWIDVARKAVSSNEKIAEKMAGLKEDVKLLEEACEFMRPLLEKAKQHLPTVICHNDLLSGNVMVPRDGGAGDAETKKQARFIDFEYCRRDFALYDIANNWDEWAGYDNDFSKYPNQDVQTKFLINYFSKIADLTDASPEEKQKLISEENIRRARIAADFLSLAANLTWSVWSIVQHAFSVIDFDYLDYYKKKYARFQETRKEFSEAFVKEFGL